MKTGWFLGGALAAVLVWTAACGSDSGSSGGGGDGNSSDGGGQQGGEGGPGSKVDGGGGGGGGDDGGAKGGSDGGDSGSTIMAGTAFGPPVMGDDNFGATVALSADGTTLAIGALSEASNATGIGGDQKNTAGSGSGAVFVYAATGGGFALQAYVKASNTGQGAHFGYSVALSADGSTMIVGAVGERSNATGVNGNQADTSTSNAGAAYVFTRSGTTWSQQAYLKASNTQADTQFGTMVALSGDGATAVVGAPGESSGSSGINGNQNDMNATSAGAAYVFARSGATWSQQAYVKASNAESNVAFGTSGALSADGSVMAISGPQEYSKATGINGDQSDTSLSNAGAVYAFVRTGTTWTQQAYIKPSNTKDGEKFGNSVSIAGDGNTLVVGAFGENSNATGINGNQADTSAFQAGAAFVFTRSGVTWSQQAYLKASDTAASAQVGWSTAISTTGDTLIVGAPGMNTQVGAAYLFTRSAGTWTQKPRLVSNLPPTGKNERFGYSAALSTTPAKTAVGLLGIGMVETF